MRRGKKPYRSEIDSEGVLVGRSSSDNSESAGEVSILPPSTSARSLQAIYVAFGA